MSNESAEYADLIRISSILQMGEVPTGKISEEQVAQLVFKASCLSLETDIEKQIAYDIITRLIEVDESISEGLLAASKMILARIGNFPGIALLQERYGNEPGNSLWMGIEESIRKAENTFKLENGEKAILNDFQSDYMAEFDNAKSLSISGPTSAGKSFALSLIVAKTLEDAPGSTIVYIVPTRALIRQVSRDLRGAIEKNGIQDVVITAVPYPVDVAGNESVIYVLTQERLHSLLYTPGMKITFDLVIVDEATEISTRGRGVLLERSIQYALQACTVGKIIFSSALCGNPEFMNTLFALSDRATSMIGNLSPVSQNIFSLSEVPLKPKLVKMSVKSGTIDTSLGNFVLPFKFREAGRLPAAALHFTQAGDSSIVYSNRAADAEDYSSRMANAIAEDFSADPDISTLCDFLNTTVHPNYSLIKCLKKGVAFHYGSMPDIVREEVENLFSQRKIKFICCTSTLLQGVNLPAKNIFLFNPQRGSGKMITAHDFWNLIGRAGRMGKEFHGNVWCIAREKWDGDPLAGKKHVEVRDAFSKELDDSGEEIINILSKPHEGKVKDASIEQAANRVVAEFFLEGLSLKDSLTISVGDPLLLEKIDALQANVLSEISLPKEIFKKNPSYSPWHLERLKKELLGSADLRSLIPIKPYVAGGYARFEKIVEIVGRVLIGMHENSHKFYAWLGHQWMFGTSLKQLIDSAVTRKEKTEGRKLSEKEISSLVRETIENIDSTLRFKLVSAFKAYSDVLAFCMDMTGQSQLKEDIPPIHIYLEFGTSDSTVISLIGAGLSRSTAIELSSKGILSGLDEHANMFAYLRNLDVQALDIPLICKKEIRRLIG